MNKKRIVFTDLDGTLLDHYTYQTDAAEETIVALKFNKIDIVPNTSKTEQEILLIREQLALEGPFITENGAAVYIPINYFPQQPADTKIKNGFWVKSFTQSTDFWVALLKKQALEFESDFQGFSQLTVAQLAKLTGLSEVLAKLAMTRNYSEPINWIGTEESKHLFIQKMTKLGANILQGGRFLHVSGLCNKGQAQAWLTAQYQQASPQDEIITIALGDGENDNAMLEQASIAIQIHSPAHDFPKLQREHQIYQSKQYGPAGWAEMLQTILLSTLTHD